ncbi:amidohydrolase [Halanaerobium hydrogeniformans]|uniref:5-methylthioadenosine/S-adenosylhomocysteine deaminase n=1 Tax=Halanaerobium hydrogeniformans TaxID=656519 RepID=E4RLP5_HALHG|nr:amidohydrolase [Halanaerobium hydrogeniformans]ADQ14959.1 amidohydrolase [Halanaerobium hydrogeniformans]
MGILIKNILEIYSGVEPEPLKNQYLIIEDDKIKEISAMDSCPTKKDFSEVIDAEGKILLPGLINTHTHTAMTLMRGYADDMPLQKWLQTKIWPFEAKLKGDDIYWGTALGVLEMLKGGTTAFADMYFAMDRAAEVVDKSGIRAVLAEGLIEANDGDTGLKNSLDFALEYNNSAEGRITTMLAPHAPYTCSRSYLEKITKLAADNNLAVHIHLSETKKEVNDFMSDHSLSPIKFLAEFDFFKNHILAAHVVHPEPGDLEILKKNRVNIAHNPISNAKLGSGIAPIADYLAADINVSIGTDGVSSNNNLDLITEARMAAYLQKVNNYDPSLIDTQQLLEMLTINGAKTLNLAQIGMIKEGKKADLILVDTQNNTFSYPHHNNLSNLFYAADSRIIDTVIINGKIIVYGGEIKTLDQEKIYYQAEKSAKRIADNLK